MKLPARLRRRLRGLAAFLEHLLEGLPDATRDEVLDAAIEWCDAQIDGAALGARGVDLAGDLVEEVVGAAPVPGAGILGALADRAIEFAAPAAGRWVETLTDRQLAKARAWIAAEVDEALASRDDAGGTGDDGSGLVSRAPRMMSALRARASGRSLPKQLGQALVIARLRADEPLRTALGVGIGDVEAAVTTLGAG